MHLITSLINKKYFAFHVIIIIFFTITSSKAGFLVPDDKDLKGSLLIFIRALIFVRLVGVP